MTVLNSMRVPIVRRGSDDLPIAWWEWLFAPIIYPVCFIVMIALCVWSVPYFWLYPERHRIACELRGDDDEEMELLGKVRAYRKSVGIVGRLKEKVGVVSFDLPSELLKRSAKWEK